MPRPSPSSAFVGGLLIMLGVSSYFINWPGYLFSLIPTHTIAFAPKPKASAHAFETYHDKVVTIDLPNGWRWLAQKPDGSEEHAAYFALSRFQGQNVLGDPVSVRVDAFNNPKQLGADDLLKTLQQGFGKDLAYQPISPISQGLAGMSFVNAVAGRKLQSYVFVKPAGPLAYVLSVRSQDARMTTAMAKQIVDSMRVELH